MSYEFRHRSTLQEPAALRGGGAQTVALIVIWAGAVLSGFAAALIHEQTPAVSQNVIADWPARTVCVPPGDKPMLVVFIHPKCPCTRASLAEIGSLHETCGDRLDMQFVFLDRGDAPWQSTDTEHWETVRDMGAGPAFVDVDGREHRRFGATTSGEVFLYLPTGELAFHGGVTVGRGHAGESPGRAAITAIVTKSAALKTTTPVYGCSLESPCCQAAENCGPKEQATLP
jgi:hypothetical protein